MAEQINDLWGPLDIDHWYKTPCITDRIATKNDVESGLAVFYINNPREMEPLRIKLPACAIHTDEDTKEQTPVIMIQAEKFQGQKLIGYRFLNGGNGIGLLSEFTILAGPDKRFIR
ncbi:MAG: hypothetical protein WAR22_10180 [Desulfomonilia bacterium]|jgi:hypothetical protein